MLEPAPHIRFDFGAAAEAARWLRLTAAAIDEVVRNVDTNLPLVTEDWRGGARRDFDTRLGPRQDRGPYLASDFRKLAARIDEGADAARKAITPTTTRGVPR